MATTKRTLVNRIAAATNTRQETAKDIIQSFLNEIIEELSKGNRLEFREFGVFHVVQKKARMARNPRTGVTVHVPATRKVHFKVGRTMKQRVLGDMDADTQGADPAAMKREDATGEGHRVDGTGG